MLGIASEATYCVICDLVSDNVGQMKKKGTWSMDSVAHGRETSTGEAATFSSNFASETTAPVHEFRT